MSARLAFGLGVLVGLVAGVGLVVAVLRFFRNLTADLIRGPARAGVRSIFRQLL